MNDPNATYKSAYQSLREELGREPTCRDKGWLEIGEAYRRAWSGMPAETEAGPWQPVPGMPGATYRDESHTWAGAPLTIPGAPANGDPALSAPKPPEEYSRGSRGPNGGVLAVCVACGQEWERERRKGRPSYKCGGCR